MQNQMNQQYHNNQQQPIYQVNPEDVPQSVLNSIVNNRIMNDAFSGLYTNQAAYDKAAAIASDMLMAQDRYANQQMMMQNQMGQQYYDPNLYYQQMQAQMVQQQMMQNQMNQYYAQQYNPNAMYQQQMQAQQQAAQQAQMQNQMNQQYYNNQQTYAPQQNTTENVSNEAVASEIDNIVNSAAFASTVPMGHENIAESSEDQQQPMAENVTPFTSSNNVNDNEDIDKLRKKSVNEFTGEELKKYWKTPIWSFGDVLKTMGYDEKKYNHHNYATDKNITINPYYDWVNSPAGKAEAARKSDDNGLSCITKVINDLKSIGKKPLEDPTRTKESIYASMIQNQAPINYYAYPGYQQQMMQNQMNQYCAQQDPNTLYQQQMMAQQQAAQQAQMQNQQYYNNQQQPSQSWGNVVNPYLEWKKTEAARQMNQQFYGNNQQLYGMNPPMMNNGEPDVDAAAAKFAIPPTPEMIASPYSPFM